MLWITWASLLVAMLAYTALCFIAVVHVTPNPVLIRALSMVAASEVIALFLLRRTLLSPALELLQTQPENQSVLARWKTANIVTWALGTSVALYGLVLRYVGFTFQQVFPFLLAGFILMLFYYPRRPVQSR